MKTCEPDIGYLDLDPDNPRLPEELQGDEDEIMGYIVEHGVLGELAYSFLENGFFEAERLIVITNPRKKGRYIVVEGNRRLATLKILHGDYPEYKITDQDPTRVQLAELKNIPCLEATNRDEVNSYLAHRHIGGMKTWSPEARARFIRGMVETIAQENPEDTFRIVARKVGSNTQGIRNSYTAISVLAHARDELGLNVQYLLLKRFGVWLRAMNSPEIRSYIGIGAPGSYTEVRHNIESLGKAELQEVVADLSIRPDGRKPLISDSRWITEYGLMLSNDRIRGFLRQSENFGAARTMLSERTLPQRLEEMVASIVVMTRQVAGLSDGEIFDELNVLADDLYAEVRTLRALLREGVHGSD